VGLIEGHIHFQYGSAAEAGDTQITPTAAGANLEKSYVWKSAFNLNRGSHTKLP
jgi:hypothetical protein